jgi:hypothetical protein
MPTADEFKAFCQRDDPAPYLKGANGKFQCPCCQCFTLDEVARYDICPVCFWEDDGTDSDHGFSPNGVTLTQGRENYHHFGASKERSRRWVRKPLPEELEPSKG